METVPVHRQTLEEVIGGSGAVEQAETVNLITQLTAQVLEVPVKIGDLVKKGALLVRWDDRLIKATVEANREYVEADKIKIRNETRQVERYSTLQNQKMGSAVDLEKYEMALADAKIDLAKSTVSLKQAEIDLEHVKQISPIDGIVLERLVNPNEFTKPGQVDHEAWCSQYRVNGCQDHRRKNAFCAIRTPCRNDFSSIPQRDF